MIPTSTARQLLDSYRRTARRWRKGKTKKTAAQRRRSALRPKE